MDIAGLLVFLLFDVCFAGALYCNVRKFLDVSFHVICFGLAVASLLVSLQLHCDEFDGLLSCCVVVISLSGLCVSKFSC